MTTRSPASTLLTALFTRRTWGEFLYALLGLPLGIAGFVFTVVTLSFSVPMTITLVGLPLIAITGLMSRWLGQGMRRLANRLAGAGVAPPEPFHGKPGVLGWLSSCLSDGTAWRARLYLLLKLPLGIASFTVATAFFSYGIGGLTYWIWRPFLPCNNPPGQGCHAAVDFGDHGYLDTWWELTLTALAGLIIVVLAPWVVRGVLALDNLAVRALLGPSWASERVEELEHSRAHAVDESAGTLRRIERDLHDGTQARLVTLAMNVGLAKEKLAEGGDPAEAARLLDSAHVTAKDAISELRDLVRGIHPPILDAGLDVALATLTAHSAVPVTLRTAIDPRPAPAIETIAYFCAAELLTNVNKHSDARTASVEAVTAAGMLYVRVGDDGHGGARIGAGSGLSGLAERVRTVDGTLTVDSPPGGPTTVTAALPIERH